jgi:hypothetical protein
MVFRNSSDPTPLTFAEGVSEDTKTMILAFFEQCHQNALVVQRLHKMREERDEICKLIGFPNYELYWSSPFWKKIRRKVLKRDQRVCLVCEGKANQVHHRSYTLAVLNGDDDSQLVTVCAGCHAVIHRDDSGRERPIEKWDAILYSKNFNTDFLPSDAELNHGLPVNWKRMSARKRIAWKATYQT